MRIHVGKVPENPEFHPESEGWHAIWEPNPIWLQFMALPPAFVLAAAMYALAWCLDMADFSQLQPAVVLGIIIGIIPVHELIHAAVHPGCGLSNNSILGVWPTRLIFYAHYDGTLSRQRFLAVFLAPLLVLSPGLTVAAYLLGMSNPAVGFLACVNALFSCGDVVGVILLVTQIPADALVRNQGWQTYWRQPEEVTADPI